MKDNITLTESAALSAKRHLKHRGSGFGLRLGVKTTGCSGLAYVLEFVDTPSENDIVFESRGIKLVVDKKSHPVLAGIELDYKKNGLNEGFEFNNPNAKAECGCGESFTV